MSSENIGKGPLDITRDINFHAEELDEEAVRVQHDPELTAELGELLGDIDEESPLLGQNVIIYGTALTASMDEDGHIHPLANPETGNYGADERPPASGVYQGLTIRPVYETETNSVTNRVVHILQTGTENYIDEFYNGHTVTRLTYVLARGAEVLPTLPKNAHSLKQLERDAVIAAFDKVVLGGATSSRIETIKAIGKLANRILPNIESHDYELNMQRLSYLNSLDLLSGLRVVTNDFVTGSYDSLTRDNQIYPSNLSQAYSFEGDLFEAHFGYERTPEGVKIGLPPELYVRSDIDDGKVIYAPTKSILAYQNDQ